MMMEGGKPNLITVSNETKRLLIDGGGGGKVQVLNFKPNN
jgi:hypothetical protein